MTDRASGLPMFHKISMRNTTNFSMRIVKGVYKKFNMKCGICFANQVSKNKFVPAINEHQYLLGLQNRKGRIWNVDLRN
jgi:hypothetical protein